MRITLIALNQEKYPYPVQPIGLAYIAGALVKNGHEVKMLDLCFSDDYQALLGSHLQTQAPEALLFSIRNIDSTSYPESIYYLPRIQEVIAFCKTRSKAHMIVGGSGFSIAPREILAYLDLEMGVVGEGEGVVGELLDHLALGKSIGSISGLVFQNNGVIQVNARRLPADLDQRLPAREFLDVERYVAEGGITSIQSKRGCHFNCIYCTYPLIEGRTVRLRNPAGVVAELEQLNKQYGLDSFCFVDNVFNYPMEHAVAICRGILQKGLKIQWTGFFHPRFITPDFAELLSKAGCSGVELGIDSAADEILEQLQKGFGTTHIIAAMDCCKKAGLNTCCCLILGGPGENLHTLTETFAVMEATAPDAVIAYSGIRIYPDTEMERIALKEGYDLGNHLEPRFYISKDLHADLVPVIQEFARTHPNFIYGGMPNEIPLDFLKRMRKRGVKGPFWELKSKFSKLFGPAAGGSMRP